MLTTNNNIELRNLQEQVLKNKEDIARHYEIDRTLANFGIKIVGTVATVNDLPDAALYDGEYGDGYAVGQAGSYTYYIFTRPDPNQGINTNYWLDVGQLGIQGPTGPQGPVGPQGEKGDATMWYTSSAEGANANPGDLWLRPDGSIVKKGTAPNVWHSVTNIKGPQGIQGIQGPKGDTGDTGPQGPKGDTGDVGGFINIAGSLTSASVLPDPATIKNLTVAYLVGTTSPQDLYIQVGSDSDTAIWENMGPLNVATYVTVNGQYQNVWDADTKLNLIEPDNIETDFVLVVKYAGGYRQDQRVGTFTPKTSYSEFMPVLRGLQGQLRTQMAPSVNALDCINYQYFRDHTRWYDHRLELSTSQGATIYITLQKPYSSKITMENQIPLGSYIVDYGWVTRTADNTWNYDFNNGADTGGGMTVTIVDDTVSAVI